MAEEQLEEEIDLEEEGDEEGEEDEFTPPSKDEWERTTAALKKANAEAKKYRLRAKGKEQKGDEEGAEDDEAKAKKAAAEAESKWKPRIVKSEAKVALRDAGLVGKPDRLLSLIDYDEVEVDEDGDVAGLEGEVDRLKDEFPELFKKTSTKKIDAAGKDGGDGDQPGKTKISSSQRQAAAILGRQ